MVPPKKKSASRKRVLDLESRADSCSPPTSTWQSKYRELLPVDSPNTRNGTSTSGGLVGDYDSSSESDSESSRDIKIKPPDNADHKPVVSSYQQGNERNGEQYQLPGSSWIECYDKNSGFPYYWNQVTNQVTWQTPPEYLAMQLLRKQQALIATTAANPAVDKKETDQPAIGKPGVKYPWERNSDSEGETEPKAASDDDSDSQSKVLKSGKKKPVESMKPAESQRSRLLLTNEEGQDVYETSSLMTPLVPDTGPPGAELPAKNIDVISSNGTLEKIDDSESCHIRGKNVISDLELADQILAEIEKEVPPDFVKSLPRRPSSETKASTSFALIASYGDDSDQDDANDSTPKTPCIFPSVAQTTPAVAAPKALFPSAVEPSGEVKPVATVEVPPRRELLVSNSPPAVLDPNLPDSTSKFKRKKRIEFAPAARSDVVPKTEVATKASEPLPDYTPVTEPNTRYNMEPGERRGFGFSVHEASNVGEKKASSIKFIKAEVFTLQPVVDQIKCEKLDSPIPTEDLTDGATLLKEKLTFLGEGKEEVSAIQQMAIQLETLVSAWQGGALTPGYLSQWLGSRAIELAKNEQAAAPPGWTCEWERDAKRYCYRNTKTGVVVWDYPEDGLDERLKTSTHQDSVQDEVEMELSNTPPRLSPNDPDSGSDLIPPPPPDISRSSTPPPPPAPIITKTRGTKRPIEEVTPNNEADNRYIPPPPPPTENYPPPPPEPEQPPPPGVDASGNNLVKQPPMPLNLPPVCSSNGKINSNSAPNSNYNEVSTKRCLTTELDSFYMDLAKLSTMDSIASDNENSSGSNSGSLSVSSPKPPLPSEVLTKSSSCYSPPPQTSSNLEITSRKRKKGKITPGLTLKKKGVSTLVAKWQQVQEDARRNYSSDEDTEELPTTH